VKGHFRTPTFRRHLTGHLGIEKKPAGSDAGSQLGNVQNLLLQTGSLSLDHARRSWLNYSDSVEKTAGRPFQGNAHGWGNRSGSTTMAMTLRFGDRCAKSGLIKDASGDFKKGHSIVKKFPQGPDPAF